MTRIAYVNGEYSPLEDAKISILDRGFLFADGVYEVAAVLDGKLADYAGHVARLHRSLGELQIAPPVGDDELLEIHRELVKRNAVDEGLVYLQVTRGAGERDFPFPKDAKPSLVLFTQAKNLAEAPIAATGYKVKTVPDIRWARRDIKSVALLAQVLAKQAAADSGCNEAWMVEDGKVTEGGSSNAYIIKDGRIITRPVSNKILSGITRASVLKLAAERDMEVEERVFSVDEALAADEAFVTAASTFVMPVVEIDGKMIGGGQPGPVARRLREIYIDHARSSAI
ncbi:D-amino-acid transaminase [Tepidamorphus sp. 3E244]|uniref:D-amino-acid transaminase n=1 Tax=Tepidamorphus sp. 3E244 TaxID=3385498 RepID=UPI0038FD2EE6